MYLVKYFKLGDRYENIFTTDSFLYMLKSNSDTIALRVIGTIAYKSCKSLLEAQKI